MVKPAVAAAVRVPEGVRVGEAAATTRRTEEGSILGIRGLTTPQPRGITNSVEKRQGAKYTRGMWGFGGAANAAVYVLDRRMTVMVIWATLKALFRVLAVSRRR